MGVFAARGALRLVACAVVLGFNCCLVVVSVLGISSHSLGEFRGSIQVLDWFGVVLGIVVAVAVVFSLRRERKGVGRCRQG